VQAPASYVAPYVSVFNDTIRRVHAGMLALLDEAVGNVTRALQETGLLDSSVVLTSTDNGGPVGSVQPCGDCNGALNYPLRGGKHSLYQGGVKGTGFVWSSALYGTSPANRTWGGLAHITDWFPTILSWLNVSHTQDPAFPIHGYDLSAAIAAAAAPSSSSDASDASSSSSSSSPRPLAVLNIDPTCDGNAAIVTNESMKLLLGDPGPPWGWDPATEVPLNDFAEAREIEHGSRGAGVGSRSACSQSWPPTPPVSRLWPLTNTSVYLYNLTAAPREMMDVSAAHPALVQQLTGVLAEFAQGALWPVQNATNDPRGDSKLHNGTWVPWL
jgi:arylsulfatase B